VVVPPPSPSRPADPRLGDRLADSAERGSLARRRPANRPARTSGPHAWLVSGREQGSKLGDGMGDPVAEIQTRTGIGLTKLFDECSPADSLAPYQARIREWAVGYLSAPHPALGREGAVCPFTAASISKEKFWVGCVDSRGLTAEDIESSVAGVVSGFRHLPPAEGSDALLKTILVLFPTVTDYRLIDEAQRRLKEASVARGLMIGQFYPGCAEPGIRNPDFRPLQSPVALLAIRHMVSSDLPFLTTHVEWVEEYLKRFAPAIPAAVRGLIAAKFNE
jgi:hypothetical protein